MCDGTTLRAFALNDGGIPRGAIRDSTRRLVDHGSGTTVGARLDREPVSSRRQALTPLNRRELRRGHALRLRAGIAIAAGGGHEELCR